MKYAVDFRAAARDALRGRWGTAVLAGFLASLLGGVSSSGNSNFKLNSGDSGSDAASQLVGQDVLDFISQNEEIARQVAVVGGVILLVVFVVAAAFVVLGSVVGVGYRKFNLDLVDRKKEPETGTLFGFFPRWKTLTGASLLKGLYIFLWMLLFIIPGIIAAYDYAMTDYILAEHPELTASQAIKRSKAIMRGNRRRLFWLEMSFFGWDLLCALSLGIGNLWLVPYKQAAYAEFYRDITTDIKKTGEVTIPWTQSFRGDVERQFPQSDDL